ncbi:hypothetical protein [Streptomyces tanashiensis]|uniref:hypothetical protein n=1 Tax=Streptomyces tanashiensis TaxID=67367 RepID=UPI00342EA58E
MAWAGSAAAAPAAARPAVLVAAVPHPYASASAHGPPSGAGLPVGRAAADAGTP